MRAEKPARWVRVAAGAHTSRIGEVLEVVDELAGAAVERARHGEVVEHRQVLHESAQPDPAGVGQTGMPNFAASRRMAMFSLTPPTWLLICMMM